MNNQIKGPGLWKMNCALLKDDHYVDDIKSKIPVWLKGTRTFRTIETFGIG